MIYLHNTVLPFRKYKETYHMVSDDSLIELYEFAQKIGLKKSWFQDKTIPHYDIFGNKIQLALSNGAIIIDSKKMYKLILHWRKIKELSKR